MIDVVTMELEGVVGSVLGNEEHGVGGRSGTEAFEDNALGGVEDIGLAPLEEEVGKR